MTTEEKLIQTHLNSLLAHYGDKLKSMKFASPVFEDKDSVISISESKREAYLTRHYISGHYMGNYPTHAVIFNGDWFDRI